LAVPVLFAAGLAWGLRVWRVPRARGRSAEAQVERKTAVWLIVVSAVACVFVAPWTVTGAALVLSVALVFGGGDRPAGAVRFGARLVAGLLLLYVVYSALYALWIPHEKLFVEDPKSREPVAVVGYVLDDNADWWTVLTSGPRLLEKYRKEQIQSRAVCQVAAFQNLVATRTLVNLVPSHLLSLTSLASTTQYCSDVKPPS
jgi:hypothetical protein